MSRVAPTAAQLVADRAFDVSKGEALGDLESLNLSGDGTPRLLSPVDLQCVKAAEVRAMLEGRIGGGIRGLKPGSKEAMALKQALIDEGMWSQYLEVAIGPDAEIFTKSPVLSTVGWGADIGVRSDSSWNNPEPEIAILADSYGEPVGASLGNDVNLRDFEGRSALLLGKAKDNNASCSLGPLVRLFDASFTMDDVRDAQVDLLIEGEDGYVLKGHSSMREISRDPTDLVAQAMSEHHYPDGYILFLGTLFAPTQDRDDPGRGFTHKVGDIVSISTPKLGKLVNRGTHAKDAKPWTLGIGGLMQNLVSRGLLGTR
jgi:fumarylacetoacetate (FAA) hydrolase family protein